MSIRLHAVALTAALMIVPSAAQVPPTPTQPPVEAFGNLPIINSPSLSPDGKHLAMIQARNGRPVATIWALEPSLSAPVIFPYKDGFIDDVRWANDHRLLIRINLNARVLGDDVNPWYRTIATNIDGTNMVVLFSNQREARDINYSASRIVDIALNDPDHIYIPLYSGGGYILGVYEQPYITLFKVDVNTGFAEVVKSGGKNTTDFIMDGNGNLVARLDLTKKPLVEHLLAYTPDKDWREVTSADATGGHGLAIEGLAFDGKALIQGGISSTTFTTGLRAMSVADGNVADLYFNPLYDANTTITSPWTGRIVGITYVADMTRSVYFDPQLKEIQTKLESNFPAQSVQIMSWDAAINKVVVAVESASSPTNFYIYDRQTNVMLRIGRAYPQLNPSDLGETKPYNYKARDGLEIPAYLTLPPGKTGKNLPVVILPHGGPHAVRDDMNFDWERQFFANRGYAVLQPNFRGSSGYGSKFEDAGHGEWGLKMQDDVTDGVKKLIADGIADPKRICIVGGSYGGYAALAGAAFTPDLYACAAAWAPVTDIRELLYSEKRDSGGDDSRLISALRVYIGDRSKDSEKLDAVSPAENAAKIKVPVLLMHGEADATVRINQSEIMERALRRAGKKVTFIPIPKETHYMQTAETRIRWLAEVEKFLKENIGN